MPATLADIRGKAQSGAVAEAEALLRAFLSGLFGLDIAAVEIRKDTLSLNSVNGFLRLGKPEKKAGATSLFFKFHQEDSEEGLAEYYNGQLLAEAGYPIDQPLYVSKEVGRQVLLYPLKTAERLADVCKRIELGQGAAGEEKSVLAAQQKLDELACQKYLATLHKAPPGAIDGEPLLQLFYYRLVDGRPPSSTAFGGRYASFYAGKRFEFPGSVKIDFEPLSRLRWRVNGITYTQTLDESFRTALALLSPVAHHDYMAVVAHGDAHNGNVWYDKDKGLSFFDPAFAGKNVPVLLAEIKATFHNIFAHPLWLYDAGLADPRVNISLSVKDGIIDVTHDWQLSPLREGFLRAKRDKLWKPLLKELSRRGSLPADWESYMRAALFCCPTLVMNLRAGAGTAQNSHTPKTSLLGLCVSVMLASAPTNGKDTVAEFFTALRTEATGG
jgi:hypothetical protein